jgi:head-tail adaptor
MVQTNKLTELLTIKELTVSATTYGEAIETYKPVLYVYGSIINQKGNTTFTAPGAVYNDAITFYLRYLPILQKKKYRIEYGGKDYEINNVTMVQRNAATVIDCSAVL